MTHRYVPGPWYGVVTDVGVALLPPTLDLAVVEGVWDRMRRGKGLGGVLEVLTGAFGTSLSAIPPFAVAVIGDDEVRLAVRGALEVRAVDAAGALVVVAGTGVTTWSERMIDDPAGIELVATDAPADGAWMPLLDGVVPAASLRVVRRDIVNTVDEPAVVPVPVVEPVELAPVVEPATPAPLPADGKRFVSTLGDQDGIGPTTEPPAAEHPPVHALQTDSATAHRDETSAVESKAPAPAERPAPPVEPVAPAPPPPPAPEETWAAPVETAAFATTVPSAPVSAPPVVEADEYDDLWGPTIARPIAEAAVASEPVAEEEDADAAAPAAAQGGHAAGDHDGETISFEQLQALRNAASPTAAPATPPASAPPPPPPGGSMLIGPPPAARTGYVVLSTGQQVELDRGVVIGRRPRAVRVTGGVLPHLIAVDSPQQDISRSHVEIRREGDSVVVVDLDTTNGTVLLRENAAPVRLHPGDPEVVIESDALDLGDGVIVTFRGIG